MKHIDYKATVWFRIPVHNDDTLETIKQMLEKGYNPARLYEELYQKGDSDSLGDRETLWDTEEPMSPSDNDGQPTIELVDEERNILWDNSKKQDVPEGADAYYSAWDPQCGRYLATGRNSRTQEELAERLRSYARWELPYLDRAKLIDLEAMLNLNITKHYKPITDNDEGNRHV
jgi:hypothetical protein